MLGYRWVAVKFPGGDAYAYIDSTTKEDLEGTLPWHLGYGFAATHAEALAATLAPVYNRSVRAQTYSLALTIMAIESSVLTQ